MARSSSLTAAAAHGVDTMVEDVLGKLATTLFQRLHVNIDCMHDTDEREEGARTREDGPDRRGGARRQLTPLTVLGAGVRFGVTDESP